MKEVTTEVKEKLAELQEAKASARKIYDGACERLGVENELAREEDESGEADQGQEVG